MRKMDWLVRGALSALLSAVFLNLKGLESLEPFHWGPGLAFALLVVTAHSRRPELLLAVTLSYTAGYASGELFDQLELGEWASRIGVVAVGSGLLALSLRWKGGLGPLKARNLFLLGTALAWPFWQLLLSGDGAPSLVLWIAGFAVWQIPVAWYYLKKA